MDVKKYNKWMSRKFQMVFIFSTGCAIAGVYMLVYASNFEETIRAIEVTLQYQLGGVGAYLTGNVITDFATRNHSQQSEI